MSKDYRGRFIGGKEAEQYDSVFVQGEDRSFAFTVLWHHEKRLLDRIVRELRCRRDRIDYLDFAAGTGRITAHLEDKVDTATAIEISAAMLTVARRRLKSSRIICADITAPDAAVEGTYDLITAFRFFLKADPQLRMDTMAALAARLKDHGSLLVINNHGNAPSWPLLRRFWSRLRGIDDSLTSHEVRSLAQRAGLTVDRVIGYGQLPAWIVKHFSVGAARRLEQALEMLPLVPRLGIYQLYILRLDNGEAR